jgi:hypothetical protein
MSEPFAGDAARCLHCNCPIVDPTTSVDHGGRLYCCANCAAAMEQVTGGSDPQGPGKEGEFRCARCQCVIVDEATMEERGDQPYCCRNCAEAAVPAGQMGHGR